MSNELTRQRKSPTNCIGNQLRASLDVEIEIKWNRQEKNKILDCAAQRFESEGGGKRAAIYKTSENRRQENLKIRIAREPEMEELK